MAEQRVDRLTALREHFEGRLHGAADRDATAIGRLIKDIEAELAALQPEQTEVDAVDEIAARRAARGTSPAARPSRSRKSSS
jgi:hypothetical protein